MKAKFKLMQFCPLCGQYTQMVSDKKSPERHLFVVHSFKDKICRSSQMYKYSRTLDELDGLEKLTGNC